MHESSTVDLRSIVMYGLHLRLRVRLRVRLRFCLCLCSCVPSAFLVLIGGSWSVKSYCEIFVFSALVICSWIVFTRGL